VDFLSLQTDDVYHVDVMENHAYFNTAIDKKQHVLAAFDGLTLDDRSIYVRLTEKRGQHLQKGDGFSKKKHRKSDGYNKRRKDDSFFGGKKKSKKTKTKSRKKKGFKS
jgi:hypothetical protein